MAVPFYDNLEATPIDGLTCLVEVERVYGLDWDRFGEDQWATLARIYEVLPGAVRLREVPWWFGDDEDVPPFLSGVRGADRLAGLRGAPRGRLVGLGRAVPHGGRRAALPGAAIADLRPRPPRSVAT